MHFGAANLSDKYWMIVRSLSGFSTRRGQCPIDCTHKSTDLEIAPMNLTPYDWENPVLEAAQKHGGRLSS